MTEIDTSKEAVERLAACHANEAHAWRSDGAVHELAVRHDTTAALLRAIAAERDESQATFDLRWKADMRAIKQWQAAHPGNDLVWPDHVDLVLWLAERDEAAQAENKRLREAHANLDAWATAEVRRLKRLWTYMQEAAADAGADEPMTAAEWLREFEDADRMTRAALAQGGGE